MLPLRYSRNYRCWSLAVGVLAASGCGSAADSPILQPNPGRAGGSTGGTDSATGGSLAEAEGGRVSPGVGGSLAKGGMGGKGPTAGAGGRDTGIGGAVEGGGGQGGDAPNGGSGGTAGAGGNAGLGGVGGNPGIPGSVSITAFADTYVDSCNPSDNFAASTTLLVDTAPCVYQMLLKPSTLALVPVGAVVTSATLFLTATDAGDSVDVNTLSAEWQVASVTWTNRPMGVSKIGSFVPVVGKLSIDLTSQVQGWLLGNGLQGLVFTTTGEGGSDYQSSEAAALANRPTLTVEYTL